MRKRTQIKAVCRCMLSQHFPGQVPWHTYLLPQEEEEKGDFLLRLRLLPTATGALGGGTSCSGWSPLSSDMTVWLLTAKTFSCPEYIPETLSPYHGSTSSPPTNSYIDFVLVGVHVWPQGSRRDMIMHCRRSLPVLPGFHLVVAELPFGPLLAVREARRGADT